MSRAHSRLSRSRWTGVGLRQLVDDELQPYGMVESVAVEGPDLVLTPDAAQSVTMVIHELTTNAAKYGALSSPVGRVWVHWEIRRDSQAASTVCLVRHETGGPPVLPPQRDGFGMNVIRQILPYDLGARVDVKFARGGVRCEIVNSSRSCNRPLGLSCGGARLSLRSHAAKMSKPVLGRRRQLRKPTANRSSLCFLSGNAPPRSSLSRSKGLAIEGRHR